jgi:hypothetical protein
MKRGPFSSSGTFFTVLATLLLALGCVLLLSTSPRAQNAAQDPPGRVGRVALIEGTVSHHTADENTWHAARRNYPVTTGQSFWTEPSAHAAIDVAGSRIYLDSSTELDVAALDDQTARFSAPEGAVFLALKSLDANEPYQVDIARASVTFSTAGRYEIVAGDLQHASQVTVFEGGARISGNGLNLEVHPGEAAVFSGEQTINSEIKPATTDSFVAWVEEQEWHDGRGAPAVASAITGAAQLSAYGRWEQAPRYGDVWYPDVSADWMPYRSGYWCWAEPWGWTWVDDEPWGFAPFHYGRWVIIDDRWAWVPAGDFIYAPAVVSFFASQDAFAWVPLGWDEVYVPPYSVSDHYFRAMNERFVANAGSLSRFAANKARFAQFANQRAATAVTRAAFTGSRPVASAMRPVSTALRDASPIQHAQPARPTATTASISPSVARRFGITPVANAQQRAPGPPVREVRQAPNARLDPPRALAQPTAAGGKPTTEGTANAQRPPLAPPNATHHLPGSTVTPNTSAGAVEPKTPAGSPPATAGQAPPTPPVSAGRQGEQPSRTTTRPVSPSPAPAAPGPHGEESTRQTPPSATHAPTPPSVVTRPTPPAPSGRGPHAPESTGRAPPHPEVGHPMPHASSPPAVSRAPTPQPSPPIRAPHPPETTGHGGPSAPTPHVPPAPPPHAGPPPGPAGPGGGHGHEHH